MYSTASLRKRVLAAWTASPARFREDSNAEEELVHGAYRDRLIVELAQNAADAATRAGVPGRLLLRLHGATLTAANTGQPLDDAGVEGLSTLRASAKRDAEQSIGRFGVGFAAVLAVTDEPQIFSRDGGVRWSRDEAQRVASAIPDLGDELTRRGSAVPVLRLPFDADGTVVEGYDTAVVLPLRDDDAVERVRQMLTAIDDALMLTLPALSDVVIDAAGDARTLTAASPEQLDDVTERRIGNRRWRASTRSGRVSRELVADRPTEERERRDWSVTIAVPMGEDDGVRHLPASVPTVVHAPTPTDDPTALPALIIADLPLDSSRRRVAPGPMSEYLVGEIGAAYATLVGSIDHPGVLRLVPGPLGAGEVDAALHRSVVDALTVAPFVRTASGDRAAPRDIVMVDGLRAAADPSVLGRVLDGLPAAEWWQVTPLKRLGARETSLAEVVDDLATLRLEPTEWRAIYAGLDGADPEELGALPVPLVDGRLVRGPRGVIMATDLDAERLQQFDLRVVHPEAAHPLLARLGAVDGTAAAVLADPRTQAAVEADDDGLLSDAVLLLVAAAWLTSADHEWLSELLIPDRTGYLSPARDLLLPDSPMLDLVADDPDEYAVDAEIYRRHGPDALRAVGVRDGLGIVRDADVVLDEVDHDLDATDGWIDAVRTALPHTATPPVLPGLVAVRDLDAIRSNAWPAALRMLAADPDTRSAVVDPAYVLIDDGSRVRVPSYSAWWLGAYVRINGLALDRHCLASADPTVAALLTPVELDVDGEFARAVGLVTTPDDIDTEVLLDRLADPEVDLSSSRLAAIYRILADRPVVGATPERVRVAVEGGGTAVVDADRAVVVDAPQWLQFDLDAVIVGPSSLAETLGVRLASRDLAGAVGNVGRQVPVPDAVHQVLGDGPSTYWEHDELLVDDGLADWWVDGADVHAATADGLAKGLAWAAGAWERRWLVAEALADPSGLTQLLAEDQF